MEEASGHPNFHTGLDILPLDPLSEGEISVFESEQQGKAIQKYGIAGRVWEGARIMVQYLRQSSSAIDFDPPCSIFSDSLQHTPCTILELGSGNGFVGYNLVRQLSRSKAKGVTLVLTDLPDVCSLLEENLAVLRKSVNSQVVGVGDTNVMVHPLSWGVLSDGSDLLSCLLTHPWNSSGIADEEAPRFTHIVCSDLVYFPDLLAPFLRSLLQLTAPPFVHQELPPEVLISYKVRDLSRETPFWTAFGLWFSFTPVTVRRRMDDESGSTWGDWLTYGIEEDMSFLFSAFRLPESYEWTIPQEDEELMSGVGARGTLTTKSDDTFESLLLMGIEYNE